MQSLENAFPITMISTPRCVLTTCSQVGLEALAK